MNKVILLSCIFFFSFPRTAQGESLEAEIAKVHFTLDRCVDFSPQKPRKNASEGARSGTDIAKGERRLSELEKQKKIWTNILNASKQSEVLAWIAGIRPPPPPIKKLVRNQFRCLLRSMATSASIEENKLLIENGRRVATLKNMQKLAKSVQSKRGLRKFDKKVTRSFYRKSSIQAAIWKRKFIFSGKSFNIVSTSSAEKCHLKKGATWKPRQRAHRWCWKKMTGEEKEKEILLASSAPGISRHHWGTDLDIFGLNPRTFIEGAKYFDEYLWLKSNALQFGFFQPYSDTRPKDNLGYMNERWHWSFYPIASALSDYAKQHEEDLEILLFKQWDHFEKQGKNRYFSYIRKHWKSFVFNISHIDVKSTGADILQP